VPKACAYLFFFTLFSAFAIFSSPDGATTAEECTPFSPGQYSSSLALDPFGNPHVAWEQSLRIGTSECQQNDIYYTSSADQGMSFMRVAADIDWITEATQARVSLAIDSEGNPAVAWADKREGEKYVYFAQSDDGGRTFSPGIRIDESARRQERPCLVFDQHDNPVIAWIKVHHVAPNMNPVGYIHVTRSNDGGATFLESVSVCPGSKPYQGWPALAVDSNNNPVVALHYYSLGKSLWNVYYIRSIDQGASFQKPIVVDPGYNQYIAGNDALTLDSQGNPCIAFMDHREGYWNIRFARSPDGGMTFDPSVVIDPYPTRQMTPSIGIDSNDKLYLAWVDKRTGVNNIRFSTSDDLGSTFTPSIPIDPGNAMQNRPCIDVDPVLNVPHITWTDKRQGLCYVFHTMSFNSGFSFMPGIPVYPFPTE
jgi:hypothetical protein